MNKAEKTAENDTEKQDTPPLVRLCFQTAELAMGSIGRLIRARYRHKIPDTDYKSLLYGFNSWLAFDKHVKEIEIEKRLEKLEALYANRSS